MAKSTTQTPPEELSLEEEAARKAQLREDYTQPDGDVLIARDKHFFRKAVPIITVAMVAVFILCLLSGHYPCTKGEVLACFLHGLIDRINWLLETPGRLIPAISYSLPNPVPVTWSTVVDSVVWNVRMLRMVAVIFIGGGLALSGASYQCLFRNPLVSEGILGVSNGACFGASIAILLALSAVYINIFAFVFGALAVFLTYNCSKMLRGNQTLLLVLSGTVISSLFSAGISIVKYLAPYDTALPEITFWLMGSFSKIKIMDLYYLIPIIVVCSLVIVHERWNMNVLSLGDNEAKALGINVNRSRAIIIVCSTLIASVSVCVCGAIAWVGMIIPQIARYLVGPDCRRLIPCAFFIGSIFLMLVDVACRASIQAELPVGIVTSLIGAPIFFVILKRSRTGWA